MKLFSPAWLILKPDCAGNLRRLMMVPISFWNIIKPLFSGTMMTRMCCKKNKSLLDRQDNHLRAITQELSSFLHEHMDYDKGHGKEQHWSLTTNMFGPAEVSRLAPPVFNPPSAAACNLSVLYICFCFSDARGDTKAAPCWCHIKQNRPSLAENQRRCLFYLKNNANNTI